MLTPESPVRVRPTCSGQRTRQRGGAAGGWPRRLVLVALGVCAWTGVANAELLDRLVAVVGSRPILQSDVRLAGALGLVDAPAGHAAEAEIVDRLIDRALMLDEVERFGPGEPDANEVDRRVEEVRSRTGAELLAEILERTGVPEPALRGWLRDDLRIEYYLAQRFNALAQPTGDEVSEYYEAHPEEFTHAGVLSPLADVEADIRERLMGSRRAALIDEWQQALRRRARIRLLPAPDEPLAPARIGSDAP